MKKISKILLLGAGAIAIYLLLSLFIGSSAIALAEDKLQAFSNHLLDFWYLKSMCIVVLGVVLYFLTRAPLNIQDKKVGNGQHGDARLMNDDEVSAAYSKVAFGAEKMPGILVGLESNRWITDTSDQNVLIIAPPGSGKTTCEYIPTIKYNARVNKNTKGKGASLLIVDIKGTLYNKMAAELQACGYRTPCLNLRDISKSYFFNLMYKVNLEMDGYKSATTYKDKTVHYGAAERNAKIIGENIIESAAKSGNDGSKYFNDTARGLIIGLVLLVAEYAPPPARHIISVFNIINQLAGQDTASAMMGIPESQLSALLKKVERSRVRNYTGAATSADIKTQLNILSSALQNMLRFIDAELEQLMCKQSPELNAGEFAAQPTALFIISPDENPTRHFMVSLFLRNFINDLIEIASAQPDETIGRQFLLLFDEFGNYPALQHVHSLFSAIRSRGGRVLYALQSFAQLRLSYSEDVAETIIDSSQIVINTYVAPASEKTAKTLSTMLGNETILSGSSSTAPGGKVTSSVQMVGRPLISPAQFVVIPWGTFIVQKGGHRPAKFKLQHYQQYIRLEEKLAVPPPELDYTPVAVLSPSFLNFALSGTLIKLEKGMFDK